MDGLCIIDKSAGMTSRDVDNRIKKILDERGVGHLGTLDPFATGVLIVGLGKGTKLFSLMEDYDKEYVADSVLGVKTATGEGTGEVLETAPIPPLNIEDVEKAVASLTDITEQLPPRYSAKHVGGQRAYDLAREGKDFELKPQPIRVYEAELLSFENGVIRFRAVVSKGTYIRTLGETLAERLHTVSHLSALRRTRVGPFKAENGIALEKLSTQNVIPMEETLPDIEKTVIDDSELARVLAGHPLYRQCAGPLLRVFSPNGRLMAIYQISKPGEFKCLKGLFVAGVNYRD